MLRKTVIKMYIFVKHNFLKNYISINFFSSGKSVVLFTCVPPMDSLVTINVGKILQFIFHISGGGGEATSRTFSKMKSKQRSHYLQRNQQRVLPADLCTDHAHYVKNHRSTVLRRNKNMVVKGRTVFHYNIFW